jgi:hypothetical protein
MPRKTETRIEGDEEIRDATYKALCANRMTHDVADFLSCLAIRVMVLERQAQKEGLMAHPPKARRKRDAH